MRFSIWKFVLAVAFMGVLVWCSINYQSLFFNDANPSNGVGQNTSQTQSERNQNSVSRAETQFGVFWPPSSSVQITNNLENALLHGKLSVSRQERNAANSLELKIELERPTSTDACKRWNRKMAFPEYSWMAQVRVWDQNEDWLWPNLPFLLTAHGEERVERYGGIDPGKGVDNDFAAVLIRPLIQNSEDDSTEFDDLIEPLVSAEWYPDTKGSVDGQTIVHTARSDVFSVALPPSADQPRCGALGVWLIYADFLGSKPPRRWPQEMEYAGGILAYFEITWQRAADNRISIQVEQKISPFATDFDWAAWSTGGAALTKRLSDRTEFHSALP